jgi:predicted enzyme related to lactoylglutathione lyase
MKATRFEGATPIFRVNDLKASVDYYVNTLGFRIDFLEIIASVSRDGVGLFLVEGDQGNPESWVWIGVEDVESLFDEYRRKGAKIRQPPTNFEWALEMQIEDPDGNVLRMGSEPKEGQPFGPWLDMHGDLWARKSGGGWTREARL